MFNFSKPKIVITLANGKAKTSIKRATRQQTVEMLYYAVKQTAIAFKLPPRQLMNLIISIDKSVIKAENPKKKK